MLRRPNLQATFDSKSETPAGTATPGTTTQATSSGSTTTAAAAKPAAQSTPTAASVFGPNPWLSNPQGQAPDGTRWSFNPQYFASAETAQTVANMLGGKVIQQNAILPGGPMAQSQPNQMVELANGKIVNPGLIAGFYTHGYPQSYIDRLIAMEVSGGPNS